MLLTMLDNNTMQSLLRIPSHSSGPACPMLELDDFIFTRSGSAPISNEEDFNATRHSTQFVCRQLYRNKPCSSREDAPFRRGASSCPDRKVQVIERKETRMRLKRAHNFLIGLQLHQETFCTKVCPNSRDQAASLDCRRAGFELLPSAGLWEALLQ